MAMDYVDKREAMDKSKDRCEIYPPTYPQPRFLGVAYQHNPPPLLLRASAIARIISDLYQIVTCIEGIDAKTRDFYY